MSMNGNLRAAPDAEIERLLTRPEQITAYLFGDGHVTMPAWIRVVDLPGHGVLTALRSLFRRDKPNQLDTHGGESPADRAREPWLVEPAAEDVLDLEKAWHGLHFLLNGSAGEGEFPLDFLFAGGRPIGDVDVGWGPARALLSEEVAQLAEALDGLSPARLRARFDGAEMVRENVYPEIWDRDPEDDDTLGYLLEFYDELRPFVRRAADRRLGLIVWIS